MKHLAIHGDKPNDWLKTIKTDDCSFGKAFMERPWNSLQAK
ncbi:MAG: hypothetical protein PHT80_00025 [Lentisphaeria bacterium]|nr:hypothetical protein [Lentisphaeria bacterium]